MLAKHSCTLTPILSAPGSVLMTNAAFSKAIELISNFAVPPFSLVQFALTIQDQ